MAKKSKFWTIAGLVLVGVLAFGATGAFSGKSKTKSSEKSDGTGERIIEEIKLVGNTTLTIQKAKTVVGDPTADEVIVSSSTGATLKANGYQTGAICAAKDGAALIFRGVTFVDDTTDNSYLYDDYLLFAGNLQFEDCTFTSSIYYNGGGSATFKNCTFNTVVSNYYSVWVAGGSASFEECRFRGDRALKINEFLDRGDDVERVDVNACVFDRIAKKPGLAIGTFQTNAENTEIIIRNSVFNECAAWDQVGSVYGVDGFFEMDVTPETIQFATQNNTVNYTGVNA
ncbi:MAG: hypothetical protein IJD33_01980 [Clostridia bacterium]|nr:hypothetical protein [Clostridia bacterium]